MKLRLNKAHFPVKVLGPGRRIGIWVQGCSIGCPGCISQDTWNADPSKEIDIEVLLAWCRTVCETGSNVDGVTISGGEPFEQPEALAALLDGLHVWRSELDKPFDILCYSGKSYKALQKHCAGLLAKLDALIPEPFIERQPRGKLWRGSTNQPLILLSPLGHERYEPFVQQAYEGKGDFQVTVDGKRIWYIGIPEREDMQDFDEALKKQGIEQAGVSWRA